MAIKDDYLTIHGDTFLSDITNDTTFLSGSNYYHKQIIVPFDKHSVKGTDGLPYYPQGWHKYKAYVPAGAEVVRVLFYPFSSVNAANGLDNLVVSIANRLHTKYTTRISDNSLSHITTQPITSYQTITATTATLEVVGGNGTGPQVASPTEAGWLYFEIVEDSATRDPKDSYTYVSNGAFRIDYWLKISPNNKGVFANWLHNANFTEAGGNPTADTSTIVVQNKPAEGITTNDIATLATGTTKYTGDILKAEYLAYVAGESITPTTPTTPPVATTITGTGLLPTKAPNIPHSPTQSTTMSTCGGLLPKTACT